MDSEILTNEANLRLGLCTRSPLAADVQGNTVFLKGTVDDASELDTAMHALRSLPGVTRIVTHVTIQRSMGTQLAAVQ